MAQAVLTTNLSLPNKRSGKVRDLYDVTLDSGEQALLIIATDRISAFDVVMANGLPGKGVVLTQISKFWFEYFSETVEHHLLSTDVADVPGLTEAERASLAGRIMLCKKTEVVPIECIARGYITGSGWKDYQASGSVCGIELPAGLKNSDRLDEPLFTPSTKAESGHDENISVAEGAEVVGAELMQWLGDTTLSLYTQARDYAAARGIILADTKFEFGQLEGATSPILIDEIFTPDSSRFWPADDWEPGREQQSFDKQIVRNYLETVVSAGEWDKTPPGPALPDAVIEKGIARYLEAYELLTDSTLTPLVLAAVPSAPIANAPIDWSTYKALCDQPDYWSRWMLEQCVELLQQLNETGLQASLSEALMTTPLTTPVDHKCHPATQMFQLHLPVPQRQALLEAVELAIKSGLTTTQTRQRGLGGFVAAWQEYAAFRG